MGGTINAAANCVDRHVDADNGDKVALHWIGEPDDDARDITYSQLKDEVSQAANALTELGVKKGDRVAIYMPMIPEVILRDSATSGGDVDGGPDIVEELRKHVQKEIGAIAKPRQVMIVEELPKTRSGKIMRRLLKDVAENREVGDETTLADSTVMDLIKNKQGSASAED